MEELPSGAETATADGDVILDGTEAAQKQLQALKPEQRQELLEQVKLAAGLRGLEAKVKKEGVDGSLHKPGLPRVDKGRVEVQIWLNRLPSDGLQKLKDLGFTLEATPKPGKLLLGTLPVSKLEALLELAFVRRVEPPRFQ